MNAHPCGHMQRPEVDITTHSSIILHSEVEVGSLFLILELVVLAKLADQ